MTSRQQKRIIHTKNAPNPLGHYSQAVPGDGLLFTAGQLGINPVTNQLAGDTVEIQTRQALNNLKAIFTAAGASLDDVVKTTVFLDDMADFPLMNAIYCEFFPKDPPARTTVGVRIGQGALVEIEMTAIRQPETSNKE